MQYYIAIELLPLKDAVTLFFCSPVLAAVLEWAVHGDNLNTGSVLGCSLTVMGVFLVTQPSGIMTHCAAASSDAPHDAALSPLAHAAALAGGGPPGGGGEGWGGMRSLGMVVALLAATCNAVAFNIVRQLGGRQTALVLTWW